jgi:uncharacterized iron-regulated membrane protein
MQIICKKRKADRLGEERNRTSPAAVKSLEMETVRTVPTNSRRRPWMRRVHAILGLLSAFNLFVLISTGLLLQHSTLLRLDERMLTRKILPTRYRPQDGGSGVRADIVVADLHSGRLFGLTGALALDIITLAWLVMLATGLVMYLSGQRNNERARRRGASEGFPEEDS